MCSAVLQRHTSNYTTRCSRAVSMSHFGDRLGSVQRPSAVRWLYTEYGTRRDLFRILAATTRHDVRMG